MSTVERKIFFWEIKDIEQHLGGEINSITFAAGNPPHSFCYIKLFLYVTEHGIQSLNHTLVFLKGSYQTGCINCNVFVVGKDGKAFPLPRFDPDIKNCVVLNESFIDRGSIFLRCHMIFAKQCSQLSARVEDISQRIGALREMADLSDLVIYVGDEAFHVHWFLLQQRCPKFLEHYRIRDRERANVPISGPVLNALLRYAYTGNFKYLPEKYLQEFHKVAKICEFEELVNEIHLIDLNANLHTVINVSQEKISWEIHVDNKFTSGIPLFKPFFVNSFCFCVKASMKVVGQLNVIQTSIRCQSKLNKSISLSFQMDIGFQNDDLKSTSMIRLQFPPEEKDVDKYLSIYACSKNLEPDSCLRLKLDVAFIKDENTCSYVDIRLKSILRPGMPSVFGMCLLCQDLQDVCIQICDGYVNILKQKFVSKLLFEDGELGAHRSILAVSSPEFQRFFKNLNIGYNLNLKMRDMNIECGKRLLKYIYSREVTTKGYEDDLGFFDALNKYQVFNSLNTITTFLASHLKQVNICDVLIEADRRKNTTLIKAVSMIISFNRYEIFNSSSWNSLNHTRPDLISKVLQNLEQESGN